VDYQQPDWAAIPLSRRAFVGRMALLSGGGVVASLLAACRATAPTAGPTSASATSAPAAKPPAAAAGQGPDKLGASAHRQGWLLPMGRSN
jgi:hypothetical protein